MKKQILKTIITVGLLCSSKLLANTLAPTPEEYKDIVDSFKLVDTSKKELSKTFRVNENILKSELEKTRKDNNGIYLKNGVYIQHLISSETKFNEPGYWLGISLYDYKFFSVACSKTDKTIIMSSTVRYSSYDEHKKQKKVEYTGFVASFDKNKKYVDYYINGGLSNELNNSYTQIPTYNPNEFYPYFNEQRILARLYETGTCDKEATQKANIEVLLADGKWIPQEQSWNIKDEISNNINSSSQNPSLTLNQLLENAKSKKAVSIENLNEVLKNEPLNTKTLQKYNDIAYYLQQANANDEAIFLLEKIIEKFPNRTVAYLNLADAYLGKNESEKAKVNYEKYINLMKQDNKESKIPQRVLEFK